jgi:predicted lipoprotein with Yx(FWY)xxD motif
VKRTYPVIAILALLAALAVAGCGSSSSSSSSGESGYGSGEESTGTTNASSQEAGGGGAATLAVKDVGGEAGTVLVDSKGFTLYYFEKDKKGGNSTCYGACAGGWPPLTTEGAPKGMGGVQASKLGTTKRSDGTMQVTYAGWPLYTYVADTAAGQVKGQALNLNGGLWYVLSPSGAVIKTKVGGGGYP